MFLYYRLRRVPSSKNTPPSNAQYLGHIPRSPCGPRLPITPGRPGIPDGPCAPVAPEGPGCPI